MKKSPGKEESFIDRKRAYRSQLDKPIGPSLMITVLPSIVICVFVVMAAPYMKSIVTNFILKPETQVVRPVDMTKETPVAEVSGPPPSADAVILEITKRSLAREGFDPTTVPAPVLEEPVINTDKPKVDIKPLPMLIENPDIEVTEEVLNPSGN